MHRVCVYVYIYTLLQDRTSNKFTDVKAIYLYTLTEQNIE